MKKLEIATGFAHYKVLLAILGVLVSGFSFEVWKWNKERNEKEIAEREKQCQQRLDSANKYVQGDRFLKAAYYAAKSLDTVDIKLNKPREDNFKVGKEYVLIYDRPINLIPDNPRYEGKLFETLSRMPEKYPPQPLLVSGNKFLGDKIEVISVCSPIPFLVPTTYLYEINQKLDITPYLSPFSSF
ncbi:hypothetical protein [Anabaena azotica]|uniref:Uncharacterized protein n=1 Tax=Anabaena azotica FACHB-119 TaxID=947527 RepID=A0ABR8DAG7_9NOST|nr:hypothetical protein [Anabaena azotica]MBD2503907.1 hypothetical protein [Anabaena azotica FACHB-119]